MTKGKSEVNEIESLTEREREREREKGNERRKGKIRAQRDSHTGRH